MATIQLPVRWYSGYGPDNPNGERFDDLDLPLETTAFMIVDSDCGGGNPCVEEGIAPALQSAARRRHARVLYPQRLLPV